MDIDLPVYSDDLPEGEAFPTISPQQHDVPEAEQFSSPTVVAASQRKKRAPRTIPLDVTMELRNKDLADWNTNYLENMKEAARHKDQARLSRLAKKNAEHYVWGAGIGGIGARLPGVNGPSPFDHFIGDNLFELFTGINLKGAAGTKRDCDSGIDDATQEESRRVRQRTEEPEGQVGRGQDDEAMFMPQGEDVELPREAPSALDDQQMLSAMPWNLSASIRGSSVVPRSTRTGLGGSTGLHGRGGSRMTSASPLKGYGQSGGLQPLEGGDDGFGSFGDFDFGGPGPSSDRPDPAAAPPNARVREALSAEGQNFLGFVADAIDEKREQVQAAMSDPLQAEAAGSIDEVSFEELLPFHENTKTVAAQALMMTLTLGTKSLLDVRQAEAYDEITISLTATAKAARLAVLAGEQDDAEDDGGDERMEDDLHADEEEQEQGGQFAEQLAAGLAEREDDEEQEEVDSLYEG
jgi:meiotic recombination protein REC8